MPDLDKFIGTMMTISIVISYILFGWLGWLFLTSSPIAKFVEFSTIYVVSLLH